MRFIPGNREGGGLEQTSESPRRGVPGVEFPAEQFIELGEVSSILRPNLSNRGVPVLPGSADQDLFIFVVGRPEGGSCR